MYTQNLITTLLWHCWICTYFPPPFLFCGLADNVNNITLLNCYLIMINSLIWNLHNGFHSHRHRIWWSYYKILSKLTVISLTKELLASQMSNARRREEMFLIRKSHVWLRGFLQGTFYTGWRWSHNTWIFMTTWCSSDILFSWCWCAASAGTNCWKSYQRSGHLWWNGNL